MTWLNMPATSDTDWTHVDFYNQFVDAVNERMRFAAMFGPDVFGDTWTKINNVNVGDIIQLHDNFSGFKESIALMQRRLVEFSGWYAKPGSFIAPTGSNPIPDHGWFFKLNDFFAEAGLDAKGFTRKYPREIGKSQVAHGVLIVGSMPFKVPALFGNEGDTVTISDGEISETFEINFTWPYQGANTPVGSVHQLHQAIENSALKIQLFIHSEYLYGGIFSLDALTVGYEQNVVITTTGDSFLASGLDQGALPADDDANGEEGWFARNVTNGRIYRHDGQSWVVHDNQSVDPDIITTHGFAHSGDYFGPWIFNELQSAVQALSELAVYSPGPYGYRTSRSISVSGTSSWSQMKSDALTAWSNEAPSFVIAHSHGGTFDFGWLGTTSESFVSPNGVNKTIRLSAAATRFSASAQGAPFPLSYSPSPSSVVDVWVMGAFSISGAVGFFGGPAQSPNQFVDPYGYGFSELAWSKLLQGVTFDVVDVDGVEIYSHTGWVGDGNLAPPPFTPEPTPDPQSQFSTGIEHAGMIPWNITEEQQGIYAIILHVRPNFVFD